MTYQLINRARFTTPTTGNGLTIVVGSAIPGYVTMTGVPDGSQLGYSIEEGTNFETGIGTYHTAAGGTLDRTTIESSSAAGARITLAGNATVFTTLTAAMLGNNSMGFQQASAVAITGGTLSGLTSFALAHGDTWVASMEPNFAWSIRDTQGNIVVALDYVGQLRVASLITTDAQISAVADPTLPMQMATKQYVENWHDATKAPIDSPAFVNLFSLYGSNVSWRTSMNATYAFQIRDSVGNIALGLDYTGTLQVADILVGNPFTQNTITYTRDLINGQDSDWLSSYSFGELIISDGSNISGGILDDGRWRITVALTDIDISAGADKASAPSVIPGAIDILSCPFGGGIKLVSALGSTWWIQNLSTNIANIWLPDGCQFGLEAIDAPIIVAPGATSLIWQTALSVYATRSERNVNAKTVSYSESLINDNSIESTDWIGSYNYLMTFSNGTYTFGGMLPDGRLHINLALTSQSVIGGATQATATQLLPGVVDVNSCPPTGGVQLTLAKGGVWYVQNSCPQLVNVWPGPGAQFGISTIGSSVGLESGQAAIFWQVTPSKYGIAQAGSGGGGGGSYIFTGTGFANPRDMHDRVADSVNVNDLVAGIDPAGVVDNSTQIRAAHDLAFQLGYRYLWFPARSKINAPFGGAITAPMIYNVIFIGQNCTINTYRKVIADPQGKTFAQPIDDMTPYMMQQFTSYVNAATPSAPAKVVIMGHSGVDANQRDGQNGGLTGVLQQKLSKVYGNKPIQVIDRSIGGTGWSDMAWNKAPGNAYGNDSGNPVVWAMLYENAHPGQGYTRRWIEYAADLVPFHAFFFCQGANDNKNFDIYAVQSWLDEIRTRFTSPVPAMFSIADYGRKLQDTFSGIYDTGQAQDYCSGYQRTMWRRMGVGFFDLGRANQVLRDGTDPVGGTLKNFIDGFLVSDGGNNNQITAQPMPWSFPANQLTTNFSMRLGPNGNMNVFFGTKKLICQIGNDAENILIMEQDQPTGRFAFTVQSIFTSNLIKWGRDPTWPPPTVPYNSVPRTVTTFDLTATGTLTIEIDVRDSALAISVTSKSGSTYLQYLPIRVQADRYGGFFLPNVRWDTGVSTPAITILQAASYVPDQYMPQMTDEEFLPAATLHINTVGYTRLWWPVINAARFV